MTISKQDQRELDQVYSDYYEQFKGRKEDYFPLLYIPKKFKCGIKDITQQFAVGNKDYGIDAYYIDRESRNLYLYQFKWSDNHNLFKESLDTLCRDGFERIFGKADPEQNELLHNLRHDLNEHRDLINRVYVHFVFKGDAEAAENSEGLADRIENLENKRYLINEYFSRPIEYSFGFISDKRIVSPPMPSDSYPVSFQKTESIGIPDSEKTMHVGFIPLMDLYRIYRSMGQKFFNRNIRAGLSPNKMPNRKIREALSEIVLKKTQLPELFSFNHNGVSLAVQKVEFKEGKTILTVPRLLNGAQTMSSLAKFFDDNDGHPALPANKDVLESIRVLTKLIEYDPWSDFVTNVTICNNQQNPVEPWNLRANDRIQCDLQDKFKDDAKVFYSRQENLFESLSLEELREMGMDESTKDVEIKPLAQTFLGIQGRIDKMSRLREVFENQKLYENTFRKSYLDSDTRKIVLAYKIGRMINGPMDRLEERIAREYVSCIRKCRNLLWALLIQGVLNDPDIVELADSYGSDLIKQNDFKNYLKDLASSKVLPILRDLFRDEYREKIEGEKYEFLRTHEMFKKCMDVAYDRFGWAKKFI